MASSMILCGHQPSVPYLDQPAPLFPLMTAPVFPPLPHPGLGFRQNQLFRSPKPPSQGRKMRYLLHFSPVFCIPCFAFLTSIFGRLVALSLFVQVGFVPVRYIVSRVPFVCTLVVFPNAWVLHSLFCFIVYLASSPSFMWWFLFWFWGHFTLLLALCPV